MGLSDLNILGFMHDAVGCPVNGFRDDLFYARFDLDKGEGDARRGDAECGSSFRKCGYFSSCLNGLGTIIVSHVYS